MNEYTTREGDRLDLICFDHYGAAPGYVEAVLEANRGLADHGPILPEGVVIQLPDLVVEATASSLLRIWD